MALMSGYSQLIPAAIHSFIAILEIPLHIFSFSLLVLLKTSKVTYYPAWKMIYALATYVKPHF
jgi:hypothetical protein